MTMAITTPMWATSHYELILPDAPGAYLHYYVYAEKDRSHWRISSLYVPAIRRRQGVARRLLATITAQADENRVSVNLTAEPEGRSIKAKDLKRFYQKFGFIEIPEHICGDKHYMERKPSAT